MEGKGRGRESGLEIEFGFGFGFDGREGEKGFSFEQSNQFVLNLDIKRVLQYSTPSML